MLKETVAHRLLSGIYYPVSAVAEIDRGGSVKAVTLFDTEFGVLPSLTLVNPREIWLFTHHPEGGKQLYEKDGIHIAQLRAVYPHIPLCVLITNEDFICMEYALFLPEKM